MTSIPQGAIAINVVAAPPRNFWAANRTRILVVAISVAFLAVYFTTMLSMIKSSRFSSSGKDSPLKKVDPPPPPPVDSDIKDLQALLTPAALSASAPDATLDTIVQLASQVKASKLTGKQRRDLNLIKLKVKLRRLSSRDSTQSLDHDDLIVLYQCRELSSSLNEPSLTHLVSKYAPDLMHVKKRRDPITGAPGYIYDDTPYVPPKPLPPPISLTFSSPTSTTSLADLNVILDKTFMDVTDAEVTLIQENQSFVELEPRRYVLSNFLSLHTPENRALAQSLKAALEKTTATRTGEEKELLEGHAYNPFGLAVDREVNPEHCVDTNSLIMPQDDIVSFLETNYGSHSNMHFDFPRDTSDYRIRQARGSLEGLLDALHSRDLWKHFPTFYPGITFDHIAIDVLVARLDSLMTPTQLNSTWNSYYDDLYTTFRAIKNDMLKGHPRYEYFHEKQLEDYKQSIQRITNEAQYKDRVNLILHQAALSLSRPPLSRIMLDYHAKAVHNALMEYRNAVPGASDSTVLNIRNEDVHDVHSIKCALAKVAASEVTYYFRRAISTLLANRTAPLSEDEQAIAVMLFKWFKFIVIEYAGESHPDMEAIPETVEGIKAHFVNSAVQLFVSGARTLSNAAAVDPLMAQLKQALRAFGGLPIDQDPYDLNSVSTLIFAKKAIIRIVKRDLVESLQDNEDDSSVVAKLENYKRVAGILGKITGAYTGCSDYACALQEYQQSLLSHNRLAKLDKKIGKQFSGEVDHAKFTSVVMPLFEDMQSLLEHDPNLLDDTDDNKAIRTAILSLSGRTDIQPYFSSPVASPYRAYRNKIAVYNSALEEYANEFSNQAVVNTMHAQLLILKNAITALSATILEPQRMKIINLPTHAKDLGTCNLQHAGDAFELWDDLYVRGRYHVYSNWIGAPQTAYPEIDDPTSQPFMHAFFNRLWSQKLLSVASIIQLSRNKHTLALMLSSLPFDENFCLIPAVDSTERFLFANTSNPLQSDLVFGALIDVATHLQSLSEDPIHLMLWALRAQQAFYLPLSAPQLRQLINAYDQVKHAVEGIVSQNDLFDLLRDVVATPLTKALLDDIRLANPASTRLPQVIALFPKCSCSVNSGIPGPCNGMLVYLSRKILFALRRFRHRTNSPMDMRWLQYWELQLLAAMSPDVMLPQLRQWMHNNKAKVCASPDLKRLIRGYANQNRSAFLYDDSFFLCDEPLIRDDVNRPVSFPNGWFGISQLPFAHNGPSVDFTTEPVAFSELNVIGEANAGARFDAARIKMQGALDHFLTNWHWFCRCDIRVRYTNDPGIDAGGPSRDLISSVWSYLMNPKHSQLMVSAVGFLPNLKTDPKVGKIVAALLTLGLIKGVRPYLYFSQGIHDLLFAGRPITDEDVMLHYLQRFAPPVSGDLIDEPYLHQSYLPGKADDFFAGLDAQSAQGLDVRSIFKPSTQRGFMCGTTNDDLFSGCLDLDDFTRQYRIRWKQIMKGDIVSRFQSFALNVQEHFSRAVIQDFVPLLHGKSHPQMPYAKFFEFMTPAPMDAAQIAERIAIDPDCTTVADNNTWRVTKATLPGEQLQLSPNRILMNSGEYTDLKGLFKHWLTKRYAPPIDFDPDEMNARIAAATDPDSRQVLEEERDDMLAKIRERQKKLELFLVVTTGSMAPAMGNQPILTLSCRSNPAQIQANFDEAAYFAHTCGRVLEVPPIEDEDSFVANFEGFLKVKVPKLYSHG